MWFDDDLIDNSRSAIETLVCLDLDTHDSFVTNTRHRCALACPSGTRQGPNLTDPTCKRKPKTLRRQRSKRHNAASRAAKDLRAPSLDRQHRLPNSSEVKVTERCKAVGAAPL